jgi:putative RNA 2'-phosphotransferase
MLRLHVHLSKDLETAIKVGSRRGKPIVLKIHASRMYEAGFVFYLSKNGVWLCDQVPPEYIEY